MRESSLHQAFVGFNHSYLEQQVVARKDEFVRMTNQDTFSMLGMEGDIALVNNSMSRLLLPEFAISSIAILVFGLLGELVLALIDKRVSDSSIYHWASFISILIDFQHQIVYVLRHRTTVISSGDSGTEYLCHVHTPR